MDKTASIGPDAAPDATSAGGLDQYQIRRRLGEGGFGQVYEAWDARLCRSVALKQLRGQAPALRPDSLLAEARLAASLKHTAFVKIFSIDDDVIDGDRTQSIVMELIDGRTLGQAAREQALAPDYALDVVQQVAEAMQEAHGAHLVHGDIKPSNLMLEPSGRVRILDFGLARHVDPLATQSGIPEDPQGTIAYMAPERLLGQRPDMAGDIYALGMVLYELIAGQRPFAHLSGLGLAAAQIQSNSLQWPFGPQVDPAIVALVRAMTCTDLAARLPSMRAVREGVLAIRAGAAPVPPAGLSAARERMPTRRLRWPNWHHRGLRTTLPWAGLALLTALFAWHSVAPGRLAALIPMPYSETRAMQSGMAALGYADRDGSLDGAIASFTAILERDAGNAAAAAGLSLAYSLRYYSDKRDETWLRRADASAQQALKNDDQLALAHAAQAWVSEHHGHFDQALLQGEKALSLDPRNLFALRGKADLLIRMKRYPEALAVLEQALLVHPRERMLHDLLGKLRFRQNDYTGAERAFRRSIELEPDAVYAYANLNAALLHQNRGDEALQVLQQGLQIRPNSRLYGNLGTALFERGDYAGAAAAFEHAVSSDKGSPQQYLNWANLADTLRWIPARQQASQQAYRQAAELLAPRLARTPDDVTLVSRMGLYRAKLGEHAVAAELTARALRAVPPSADVQFRAAVAYEVGGKRAQALAQLLQAKALGYPLNLIDTEPDLMALRRDPRYLSPNPESKK